MGGPESAKGGTARAHVARKKSLDLRRRSRVTVVTGGGSVDRRLRFCLFASKKKEKGQDHDGFYDRNYCAFWNGLLTRRQNIFRNRKITCLLRSGLACTTCNNLRGIAYECACACVL